MTRQEKILKLNEYKEFLIYVKRISEPEQDIKQKEQEKQKVLVLTKKYNGKNIKVA